VRARIDGIDVECTPAEFQELTAGRRHTTPPAPPRLSIATRTQPFGQLTNRDFWVDLFTEQGWGIPNATTRVYTGQCNVHHETLRYAGRGHECLQCVRERDRRVAERATR
jgi:hypothetical protein